MSLKSGTSEHNDGMEAYWTFDGIEILYSNIHGGQTQEIFFLSASQSSVYVLQSYRVVAEDIPPSSRQLLRSNFWVRVGLKAVCM